VQQVAGRFAHADFLHVGVECEIAVRLARPLPAAGAPYDRAGAAAAVGACMAAIEVVDDRYDDYRTLDTPTLIADDFFNAACVLGEPVEDWQQLDLANVEGRMTIDGSEVGRGRGGEEPGRERRDEDDDRNAKSTRVVQEASPVRAPCELSGGRRNSWENPCRPSAGPRRRGARTRLSRGSPRLRDGIPRRAVPRMAREREDDVSSQVEHHLSFLTFLPRAAESGEPAWASASQ
jgi:hypothetical protein